MKKILFVLMIALLSACGEEDVDNMNIDQQLEQGSKNSTLDVEASGFDFDSGYYY